MTRVLQVSIQMSKRTLGLDDDLYRDLLERETGKRSTKDMSRAEMQKVLDAMTRAGAGAAPAPKLAAVAGPAPIGASAAAPAPVEEASKAPQRRLEGPYAKKLQALWVAGWNLGLVRDRRDTALLAFVERQTGIQRTEWLRDPRDATKAIQAIEGWFARDAGVDWSADRDRPAYQLSNGFRIARAQIAILEPGLSGSAFWVEVSKIIGRAVITRKPDDMEWIQVMNTWGERVRALRLTEKGKAGAS